MAENVEDLILTQLRERPMEMADMRAETGSLRGEVRAIDQKVDGVSLLHSMRAGHVHGLETRIEQLEEPRER